jgi:hypothetical protein
MIQYLVFVGAAVNLLGILSYLKNTLRGTTKPNRVTWLMWSIAPLIATAAAFSDGVRLAVLPVFMAGFGPLIIFIASFINKNSYWKLEKFDYLCGFFSVLALIFWAITKDPIVAIIFSIASDGFACMPTIAKAWRHPETETGIAFVSGLFSALTSFAAVSVWVFSQYAFALYLVIANSVLIFAIYRKRVIKF